eukprot:TRINITY_DN2403_c0_g1_i1.p1 TRINITY_DN2403_c0_g1~~TRINITY_DN2403_c0_g1_i1.p1  ORF type:complete len:526 (+),score=99.41 TRINITY_DN2403_c0_g1_i1:84-1580(+)
MDSVTDSAEVKAAKSLVTELCRHFYGLGWVSGTGGSISVKVHEPSKSNPERIIVMAPSGVQKERMLDEDMYVLDSDGSVLASPHVRPAPHKPPKLSECGPLFMKAFEMRNAGAVIHSHGMECCLVTMLQPGAKEFRISHMEMIKGIVGHGYYDELVVPIIENTARESELTESLAGAIEAYPKATAVLVRNHGIYVWGDNWIQAKTQAECYHYLFQAAIEMSKMGLSLTDPLHGPLSGKPLALNSNGAPPPVKSPSPAVVVLDIEGTTTPISFVADVLFPYAKAHVGAHLRSTYESEETQGDIEALRKQVEEDESNGVLGAVRVPDSSSDKEAICSALEANVAAMIAADRKITALKQLQGHIWRHGYAKGDLVGEFFDDVPKALDRWTSKGTKVYIYSSGSREAQRLIFGYTRFGDLRRYLSGYFDTTTGQKQAAESYRQISLSVGVDDSSTVTFATDIYAEAVAARDAGLTAVLVTRPGNKDLPESHGFRIVSSLLEI